MLDLVLRWDAAVAHWIAAHRVPPLDWLMLVLSIVGIGSGIWLIGTGLLTWRRLIAWRAGLQTVLAIALAQSVTAGVLKPAVARDRPSLSSTSIVALGVQSQSYSFPSGHASSSFAAALVLTRAWPAARVAVWTLASLIAFSRVYNGVHYPLDVVAGAMLGLTAATLVLTVSRWYIGASVPPAERGPFKRRRGSSVGRARD